MNVLPRVAFWVTFACAFAACGGDGSPTAADAGHEGTLRLAATPSETGIRPGETREITFLLTTDRGRPVPDRIVQFSIVDDPATPEVDARGATLSVDRSVTSAKGQANVQLLAGLPTVFRVRASADLAQAAEVLVFVTSGTHGSVEVAPVVVDLSPEVEIATVKLHFYDAMGCTALSLDAPPRSIRPVRSVTLDAPAVYASVSTEGSHAVIGLGMTADGTARAGGCVDLPGTALLVRDVVRLPLPLRALRPAVEGRYRATSQLLFPSTLPGAAMVRTAWSELAECGSDPARLWLDCTIDALSGSANDPLDCRPMVEGPIGDRLTTRRGPLPSGMPTSRCRERRDATGRLTLDGLADGLFPTPRSALVTGLGALAREAGSLFEGVRLQSTLTFSRTSAPEELRLEHALRSAEFPMAAVPVTVDLVAAGGTVTEARYVPVAVRGPELNIATHAFTFRLGTVARQVFDRASLRPRGALDTPGLLNAIFAQASFTEAGQAATGCAALDAALCGEIGERRGCLGNACTEGLAALARRLDAGFSALDGEDLDFFIGGSVNAIDRDGDRRPNGLGSLQPGNDVPGLWTGELRGRGGTGAFTGIWSAERIP